VACMNHRKALSTLATVVATAAPDCAGGIGSSRAHFWAPNYPSSTKHYLSPSGELTFGDSFQASCVGREPPHKVSSQRIAHVERLVSYYQPTSASTPHALRIVLLTVPRVVGLRGTPLSLSLPQPLLRAVAQVPHKIAGQTSPSIHPPTGNS